MSETNGYGLYRYSVEIKAFGHIIVRTVEAKSEAEALRMVQEEIGYEWKTSPMAYARFTD